MGESMDTHLTLRKKKVITFVLFITGVCLALSWLAVQQIEKRAPHFWVKALRELEKSIQHNIQNVVREKQEGIKQFLMSDPEILELCAQLSEQESTASDHKKSELITEKLRTATVFTENKCIFVDKNGTIRFSQHDLIPVSTSIYTYAKELGSFFDNAKITLEAAVSGFLIAQKNIAATNYLSFPCLSNKKFIGVLLVQMSNKLVPSILEQYKTSNSVLLVDSFDGRRVTTIFSLNVPKEQKNEAISILIMEPVTLALDGDSGQGITKTAEKILINARYYDIASGWGLVVQKDKTVTFELFNIVKKIFIMLGILLFIVTCVWLFFIRSSIYGAIKNERNAIVFYIGICLLCVSLAALGFLAFSHRYIKQNDFAREESDYRNKFDRASSIIAQDLNRIHFFVRSIALDFSIGKIKEDALITTLDKTISAYTFIEGAIVAYSHTKKNKHKKSLTFIDSHKGAINHFENVKDYTETHWYQQTMKKGSFWSAPLQVYGVDQPLVIYAETFVDAKTKEPLGVIAFLFPYRSIKYIAESIGLQKEKKTYIINKEGYFIYHPNINFLLDNLTIQDLSHTMNSKILEAYKKGLPGRSGSVDLEEDGVQATAFYDWVPISDWVMITVFAQDDFIVFPLQLYHNIVLMILVLLIVAFAAGLLFVAYRNFNIHAVVRVNKIYGASLLFAVCIILWFARDFLSKRFDDVVVEGRMDVEKFMNEEQRSTLVPTKTGIFADYLDMVGTKVAIRAHTWQQPPGGGFEEENIVKDASGVMFYNSIEKQETREVGKTPQEGWNSTGSLYTHKQNVFWFPFDSPLVEVVLRPEKQQEDYFLIPDFESYKNLNPEALPGVNQNINLKDFSFLKTFFSYKPSKYKEYLERNKSDLVFNIVFQRNLINTFLVYIFPFIVVLFALFVLLGVDGDKMSLVSGYIALIFSLILIHQSFRSTAQVTEIVYLEYLYSIGYALLILALVEALFTSDNKTYRMLRHILFFDMLAILTFFATLFSFYTLQ